MTIAGDCEIFLKHKNGKLQVGRENPSELKAAKLARSMARGVEDRDLKPNTKERQQIEAVIVAPPNRNAAHSKHCICQSSLSLHCVAGLLSSLRT
jgi:hypothetical protein